MKRYRTVNCDRFVTFTRNASLQSGLSVCLSVRIAKQHDNGNPLHMVCMSHGSPFPHLHVFDLGCDEKTYALLTYCTMYVK